MANFQIGSDRDPTGSVYRVEDKILRGIHSEFQGYYSDLLQNPTVQNMLGKEIVATRPADQALPGYALTLEHQRITPANYCFEWPTPMLRDAALATIEICLRLNASGAILKDATPWNILYDGTRPVLVDFTSIMPQENDLLWVAYDQFCRLFLFPLLVAASNSGRVSRALLLDSANGITDSEVVKFLPAFAWLKRPWLFNRLYLPRFVISMLRKTGQDKDLSRFKQNTPLTPQARAAFFTTLQKDVASLQIATGQSKWSQYYQDINTFLHPDQFHQKQTVVTQILAQHRPKTVVDIGCNQGGYAILAAKAGAHVTAFDTDEDSVSLLYQLAQQQNLDILPLVMDVLTPSPQGGWRASEYPSAPQRFRAEMAFALALTHHLAITQVQTFDRITQTLSDYADKWLLTEFVPLSDPRSQELLVTNRRDMSWYSLDAFLASLQRVFPKVETFPSEPAGRTLCLCTH